MPRPASYAVRRLMLDAEFGKAEVERYSKKSIYGRSEPLLALAVLTVVAIFGSILCCEATRTYAN